MAWTIVTMMLLATGPGTAPVAAQAGTPGTAGPGTAQATGPLLWQGFRAGMTKEEVRAVGRKDLFEFTDQCWGRVGYRYTDGRLRMIDIANPAEKKKNQCASIVFKSLEAKYGHYAREGKVTSLISCGEGRGVLSALCSALTTDSPAEFRSYAWSGNGVDAELRIDDNTGNWALIYRETQAAMPDKF